MFFIYKKRCENKKNLKKRKNVTRIKNVKNVFTSVVETVAARGCLPPGANVFVAASTPTIRFFSWYSYGYNDGIISTDCEQYAKLGV